MLELAGGVGLGVDVRDLLQLERAFEGDRKVGAAPEEKGVLALRKFLRPGLHQGLELDRPRERLR